MAESSTQEASNSTQKKAKKELRCYDKIPVWICEYHQEVLPYIYRAIASRYLPFRGITMVHFDSHPDLMASPQLKADNVFDKDILFEVLGIADWILPAVYAGHIKKVVWVKPPWSHQIGDKTIAFHVGRHKTEGTIKVSSHELYFCEDGLYSPLEELENCRELIVVVLTMLCDCLYSGGTEHLSEQHSIESTSHYTDCADKKLSHKCRDDNSSLHGCVNHDFVSVLWSHLEEPYILDIDMDFFSTLNPFKAMFTEDMLEASQKHKKNVDHLEATLNFLKQTENGAGDIEIVKQSINTDFLKFITKWKQFRDEPVDYELVHSAGMTLDLPVHVTDNPDIVKRIKELEHVLASLPKPTIVTVARSSNDDYTPPQSVELIQDLLIKCLTKSYENIEFFLQYKNE